MKTSWRPAGAVQLQARLFVPARPGPRPAVIIVLGSGGMNAAMLLHAARCAPD